MSKRPFLSTHVHSTGSLRDGISKIEDLCKISAKNNMTFSLTEHGSLASLVDYYKNAKKHGIKYVPGNEIYMNKNRQRMFYVKDKIKELKAKKSNKEEKQRVEAELKALSYEFEEIRRYTHLLVIAKNDFGLKNLFRLNNMAYLNGFYNKPVNNHEELLNLPRDNNGDRGLIITTACISSESSRYLLSGQESAALDYCKMMKEEFGSDFYLELQMSELDMQKTVNHGLIEIHKELGVPLTIGTDAHYLDKSYAEAHQIFLLIQGDQKVSDIGKKQYRIEYEKEGVIARKKIDLGEEFHKHDPAKLKKGDIIDKKIHIRNIELVDKVWIIESADLTFKTEKQIRETAKQYPYIEKYIDDCIENNKDILEKIEEIKLDKQIKLPAGENDFENLKKLCASNLVKMGLNKKEYLERLKFELDTIEKSGFAGLFLILEDIFKFAKSKSIPTGPARGCFLSKNKVQTTNGLKNINEVNIGDFVIGHTDHWNKVINKMEYEISEKILSIKTEDSEISGVTKDHEIFAIKKNEFDSGNRQPKWYKAEELKVGDYIKKTNKEK